LLGTREKPITSWFKTASNWRKMHYSHPFHNTIGIALVDSDGGRVSLAAKGQVATK
jgi:hypothetical protein